MNLAEALVLAMSTGASDVDAAFQRAAKERGLNREGLSSALEGAHVTKVTRVRSLVTEFPDYLLASVVGAHGLKAVAMFTLDGDQPAFAGVTTADTPMSKYPFVTAREAEKLVSATGDAPTGRSELVWGWSAESQSPYYPFYRVETSHGDRFVDQFGSVFHQLQLEATPL